MKRPKLQSSHRILKDVVVSAPKITIDPPAPVLDETPGTCMDLYFRMLETQIPQSNRGS
jgi:hypothetical protein